MEELINHIIRYFKVIPLKKFIALTGVIIIVIASLGAYSNIVSEYLKDESLNRLKESAQHNVIVVRGQLMDKRVELGYIASTIENTDDIYSGDSVRILHELFRHNLFKTIGIIYPNGKIDRFEKIIADEQEPLSIDVTKQRFFFDGLRGKDTVALINKDLVFSMPLRNKENQVFAVLFAFYDVDLMSNAISLNFFGDKGFSVITDKNGNKVVSTTNALKIKDDSKNIFVNYMRIGPENTEAIAELQKDMKEDVSGLIKVQVYEPMYLCYQPLNIDNLYLLTVIPRNVIDDRYDTLVGYTYWLFAGLALVAIIIFASIIVIEQKTQKEMADILYVDKITGGYSYEKFHQEALAWIKNDSCNKALIAFDIDNFKLINVIFGYERGNEILMDIWSILEHHIRGKGIFARKYADLFSIMIKFNNVDEINRLCRDISEDIIKLNIIDKKAFRIIPSMGIYIIGQNEDNLEVIQNYAIMARRHIKNKYDLHYNFYTNSMKNEIINRKNMVDDICEALEGRDFYPHLQPQYDAKTKKMIGAEALIRWIKPNGEFVSPIQFIPLAEEVGIIIDIDEYMFEAVCRQQYIWRSKGYDIVPISVNVSRNRLYHSNFIQECQDILEKYYLTSKDIQIEVTEGTLFEELEVSEQLVNELRNIGFNVLIDDFGMGYSSISMVKDINASELKIDKSFIDDMSEKGREMTKYVIKIAKIMNMKTVAEGVETKEQYEFLRNNDCDVIQGYYFAKPMSSEEFEALLLDMKIADENKDDDCVKS